MYREALLEGAFAWRRLDPCDAWGCLHLGARPVVPDRDLLGLTRGDQDVTRFLNGLFSAAVSDEVFPRRYGKGYSPDLSANNSFDRRADGWAMSLGLGAEWDSFGDPASILESEVGLDGGGRLFCGRGTS